MKFGLTQSFECSYLPDRKEQLLVFVEDGVSNTYEHYSLLLEGGFRRSGEQIYRPHCRQCNACQAIRIDVAEFKRSKSQKRIWNRNKDLRVNVSRDELPEYFALYEHYINHRHSDGSMFPASREQYNSFIGGNWISPLFIECWLGDELVAVAVTDEFPRAMSAMYTFFSPQLEERSLGTYLILRQIEQARLMNKYWLYLGYQIDACAKMNYKANFYPHERFFDNKWHRIIKKSE